MLTKPADREVVCHASAWDFYNRKDFRYASGSGAEELMQQGHAHNVLNVLTFLLYLQTCFVPGLSNALW